MRQLLGYLANPDDRAWTKFGSAFCLALARGNKQKVEKDGADDILKKLTTQVGKVELTPPEGHVIDPALYNHISKRNFTMATAMPEAAAKTMNPDEIRAVLRLDDTTQARRREDYRDTWRRFLLMTNVMQFMPGFRVVTTEGVKG